MELNKIISSIKTWEKKVFEKCPMKTILAICIIVVLYQLNVIQSEVSSIERDVSSIESKLSYR